MRDGLPASTEVSFPQPTYFSVGYAWFTDSYILCHSFWILFSGNDQLFSGNHQRFDIMLYGKLRFVIILIGTEAVSIILNVQRMLLHSYCGIVGA
jgi:hypothetical protein